MNLKKELSEVMLKKELCSIFVTDDFESGYTGFVLGVTDNEFLMLKINQDGQEDGYYLRRTDSISYLWIDDRDMRNRRQFWQKDESKCFFPAEGENLSDALLSHAMNHRELVYAANSEEDCYAMGWVKYFSDEILVLEECLSDGEYDGETWLRREYLDELKIEAQEQEFRKKLWTSEIPMPEAYSAKNFFEKLKSHEGQDLLFKFFTDDEKEDSYFCTGIPEYVTETEVLIYCIDVNGEYDGHTLVPLERISVFCVNDRTIRRINGLRKTEESEKPFILNGEMLSDEFLQYAQDRDALILAEFDEDNSFDGYILDWDEERIHVSAVNFYGEDDGQVWISRNSIKALSIDTRRLRALKTIRN